MRPPDGVEIPAPEFPPEMDWLGVAFLRMDKMLGSGAVLVEFWDFARINSLRTLPYLREWHARYADAGLRVIGVHSPGYSFGRDPEVVARAVERLEVDYPVLLDPDLGVWQTYGNRGWPGRYLFDRRGLLRFVHYGEGDYRETELAIHEVLAEVDEGFDAPEPMAPLRPEDEPGARMRSQTADVALPADSERLELVRDWVAGEDYLEAKDAGAAATVSFEAGSAWAVLSGGDADPGVFETDGTVEAVEPGLRLHGFQFTPVPPAPS
jgi:hypothetical protein